jgi:hypothetical protein
MCRGSLDHADVGPHGPPAIGPLELGEPWQGRHCRTEQSRALSAWISNARQPLTAQPSITRMSGHWRLRNSAPRAEGHGKQSRAGSAWKSEVPGVRAADPSIAPTERHRGGVTHAGARRADMASRGFSESGGHAPGRLRSRPCWAAGIGPPMRGKAACPGRIGFPMPAGDVRWSLRSRRCWAIGARELGDPCGRAALGRAGRGGADQRGEERGVLGFRVPAGAVRRRLRSR